jgi:VWFA-related protein
MKKTFFVLVLLFFSLTLFPQTEQHQVTVSNVVIPTRVFDGNAFINDLKIEDFELFEDGVLQKIEALYLTNKSDVERAEEFKVFSPRTTRNFYLIFQITEYNPKFEEAFDHLFNEVMTPEDTLTIMTTVKNYNLPKNALSKYTPEKLSKEMQGIIRKDAKIGAANYRSIMNDLKRIVRSISTATGEQSIMGEFVEGGGGEGGESIERILPKYRESLATLERSRVVNEQWFLKLAQELKRKQGQKNVFFFYEREFRPEINSTVHNNIINQYQEQPHVIAQVQELFQFYRRDTNINAKKIRETFADSGVDFYFLFMNKKPARSFGVKMREQSEDVFSLFKEVTRATGGIIDQSQNPAEGFKNSISASENCYLLYYTPSNARKDGTFRNIVLKVKDKEYKVTHRQGYFAF